MPERTAYEPGTPSWVDLGTRDVDAAKRFYGALFGWEAVEAGPVEETGGYAFFTLDGRSVAGVGPLQNESQPPAWTTYFATDDADALAERARAQGAQVLLEPSDVMDAGRLTLIGHPAAGIFGAWQAGRHVGAQVVNEPGAPIWNELLTRDPDAAKRLLETVLGVGTSDQAFGDTTYTTLLVGDTSVAGLLAMPPFLPDGVPSFWQAYFAVEDCDAAVDQVRSLGGSLTMPAMDAEGVGRFAGVTDPQGAGFCVIASD
jgi:predicted enzyme related to lactoylglutathione lyase